MKRFEFSLKKLLGYKEQVLKKEKNELANLRKQQNLIVEQRHLATEKKNNKNIEFAAKMSNGLSPQHIACHKQYIDSLTEKIKFFSEEIERMEQGIQCQLDLIVEITKEIETLEKLEEKQLDDYKKKEQKSFDLYIEEFISHRSFHEAK